MNWSPLSVSPRRPMRSAESSPSMSISMVSSLPGSWGLDVVLADTFIARRRLSKTSLDTATRSDGGLVMVTRTLAGSAPKPRIPPLP
jgi:hypothetical protein